jgi:cytochrome P450
MIAYRLSKEMSTLRRGIIGWRKRPLSTTVAATKAANILPFSSIPGPKNEEYTYFGSFFELTKMPYYEFYYKLHEKYGDIVRFKLLGRENVSIRRPDHIREVYTFNQSVPLREALEPWSKCHNDLHHRLIKPRFNKSAVIPLPIHTCIYTAMYRKARNIPLSITMSLSQNDNDEEGWRKFRRPVAKLLRPEIVTSYVPRVSQVALDFVNTLNATGLKHVSAAELRVYTSSYGLEAISAILMGTKHKKIKTLKNHIISDYNFLKLFLFDSSRVYY